MNRDAQISVRLDPRGPRVIDVERRYSSAPSGARFAIARLRSAWPG